jgi:hypothetical protein
MGRFETSGDHPNRWHQPVRVPTGRGDIFGAAKELVDDLDGWEVSSADAENLTITCSRKNGFLGGTSTIVVRVTGPEGIPSSETHCSSESQGALISRDRSNVAEFVRKFWMRVN